MTEVSTFETITANEYHKGRMWCHKMPHTGPVYYDTGLRNYAASLKGTILLGKNRQARLFKTAEAASAAIVEAAK